MFQIPVVQVADCHNELVRLRNELGFQWIATTPHEDSGAITLARLVVPRRSVLILGTEDHGLSDGWFLQADHRVSIPMSGCTDSLNVAIAAAVMLYSMRQFPMGSSNW